MEQINSNNVLGWKGYFKRLFAAILGYSIFSQIITPEAPQTNMQTALGRLLSIYSVHIGIFISICLMVSIIILIVFKLTNKGNIHITNTLAKAIIPSLLIGLLLVLGGSYGGKN